MNRRLLKTIAAMLMMLLPVSMVAQSTWSYYASGNVLSAYGESGYTASTPLSITLNAPADLQFNGNYKPATISNTDAWEAAGLTVPTILYNGKTNAPSMLGTYTASVSAGGATAEVVYTIKTVIDYQSFFNNGITQGTNYDIVPNVGKQEVALNNPENRGVYWDSEENCAVFDGEAYLQIDNPLGNVTSETGFTLTMDVWISSDNNGSGYFYRTKNGEYVEKSGWQRLFDLSDGHEEDCIFINAGNANSGTAHLMWCLRKGYGNGETEISNNTGRSYYNQWCTITMVVAPGGYTTLYVNGDVLTHSFSSDISKIVTVLNSIHEFDKCYLGTSIFEAGGGNADGFFYGKMRGFQTAEGALMPYFDGTDYHYLLSYATNGGNPITGQFVATIPDNLPTPTHPNSNAVFLGWYTDEELTIPVTTGVALTRNTALYAKWEEYRLDSIRLGWQVKIGNASPIDPTPYVTVNPTAADTMGYVMIPVGAEFVIIPSTEQKPLVSRLELIDKNPPLTFEAKTAGATVTFTKGANLTLNDLEYSVDNGANWSAYTYGTGITLTNIGDKISFRGNNAAYATDTSSGKYSTISCTEDCYIYGTIMSLVSSTGYANTKTLTGDYAFCQLFRGNSHIVNHPSKTLVLPATTLSQHCYRGMFRGCTGLTTAPELPATTLVSNCYNRMFNGCTNLASVTCLATSGININSSTEFWLSGVAASGTFTKAAGISWPGGISGIPSGWTTIPVVPGAFSVSSTKKVYFAPGNLQYQASTSTWQFAEHQYTNIGASNSNISSSYSGWIDLFGWGTSGYNHGAVCYQPWSYSTTNTDYYPYGSATANLYDGDGKADWGYNAISNGGNTENCGWRTLKKDEWVYLFNSRTTPSGIRYAKATVNGVTGIILLPDDWSTTYYSLSNTNVGSAAWTSNTISASDWTNNLEKHGAVFLPTSGNRDGANAPSSGFVSCWSSDYYAGNSKDAYVVYIPGDSVYPDAQGQRSTGNPVRLVRNAE